MYMPTTFPSSIHDPIEERRLTVGRPASRMEIAQRVLRVERDEHLSGQAPVEETPVQFTHRAEPDTMARLRQGISRALNAAADRIAPEAA